MGVGVTGQERPAPHEDYRELFDRTPAAYLVTDSSGTVRQASRRACRLLGTTGRFLAGRALSSFVDAEQRAAFRERLGQTEQLEEAAPWMLRVRPRGGEPVTVAVAVSAARDRSGRPVALRWLLFELPPGMRGPMLGAAAEEPPVGDSAADGRLGRLGHTLEEVVLAAASLLRADHVSVVAYDEGGEHRWMIAAGDLGDAFERVRRELAAGPCAEAVRRGRPVWTRDVVTDERWPGLVRALAARQGVHGALAAPVLVNGRAAGACLALSASARVWSETELAASRAFAAVIAQALASSSR
jgi:PAS domain S-box-containing protein